MGVLSALPLVNAGNLCCCMWVVAGGVTAAYVLQQSQPEPITAGDGALAGLLAGLVGAFVHLVLSIPIDIVMAPMERVILERIRDSAGNMPPNMRLLLDRATRPGVETGLGLMVVRRVIAFMAMLFVGGAFSTIGGLLGAVVFRRPTPPPAADTLPPV
jgi:hypothetical protein